MVMPNVSFGNSFGAQALLAAKFSVRNPKAGAMGMASHAFSGFMRGGYKSAPFIGGAAYGAYRGWKDGSRDPLSLAGSAATWGAIGYGATRGYGYTAGRMGYGMPGQRLGAAMSRLRK